MKRTLAKIAIAGIIMMPPLASDAMAQGVPASSGTIRALIIGIDDYLYIPRLRGAAADARDLENSLRGLGVADVRVMLNASATRGSLLLAFQQIADRTEPGDTVFLSLSGHGAQEPERVKGSEPDGMDAVFLLAGFDPTTRERNGEKILDKEFNHFIRKVEERGGKVLFVADTCSGGGLAREVDTRVDPLIYRAVKYTPIADEIVSVADRADALATPASFKSSLFLAAVDKQSKVPEIRVPGVGFRGALSYAVARGLEGAADLDGNGLITAQELFEYSGRVSYQMSDQRQKIVTVSGRDADPKQIVLASADRGISVTPGTPQPKPAAVPAPAQQNAKPVAVQAQKPGPAVATPAPQAKAQPSPATVAKKAETPAAAALPPVTSSRIRVAALDGRPVYFDGIGAQINFQIVRPSENPDLVWDTSSREVVSNGDIIARNVDRNDIPSMIERVATTNWLKARAAQAPQSVRVMPDDRVHRTGSRVDVEVGNLSGRSLVLLNIASDGTVQLLYPVATDVPVRKEAMFRLQVKVEAPYGADQVVAITSSKPLTELKNALGAIHGRRNPLQVPDLIARYVGPDALVGSATLYTSP